MKNYTETLVKNEKLYAVIVAPDGQKMKIDISTFAKKLDDEKSTENHC